VKKYIPFRERGYQGDVEVLPADPLPYQYSFGRIQGKAKRNKRGKCP
jgi:hypothetical protein